MTDTKKYDKLLAKAHEATLFIETMLSVDAGLTVDCTHFKAYVYDAEDGGLVKTYLDADDCRRLAESFSHLADVLDEATKV